MATKSNQRSGRKKNTRTRARAKQITAPPSTRTRAGSRAGIRGKRTGAKRSTTSRATAKGRNKAQPKEVSGSAQTTTDLEEIRQWAEERGGAPASVRGTGSESEEAGILRIDFPGGAGEDQLEHISWDEWYQKFQEKNLALLYQDKTKGGKTSFFFKLVKR
jgi:hypothetical protein